MEANTRYIIDNNLKNKGWILDKSNPNCNVDFESPKDRDLRKKLKGKHPDYILYETKTRRPIGIIEAKKTGIDLQKALNQGEGYAKILNAPIIFAMNGAYCETRWLGNEKPLMLNGEEVKEIIREREALEFLKKSSNEVYTLPQNVVISRKELLFIFKEMNNVLRGEGLRAGIERLSEFANILFLKLLSESEKYDYWDSIKNQKDSDVIGFINSYIHNDIQKRYGGDVFTGLEIENPKTLRKIIEELDPLVLSTIDTDIKGASFEYFLEKTTSTENDLGEYFTPRHIVKTMVHLVNPVFKESIYDPFCGTGGFLTQAFKYIKENARLNKNQEEFLRERTIFGGEITSNARIAKMNMILQGDGHSGVKKIDSLANPIDGKYNVVISNIPFSQKTQYSDLYYDGIARNNCDAACILHCLRALKEGGRMALIIPESFLQKRNLKTIREFLINSAKLQTIISLPAGVFLPYTNSRTSILYFTEVFKNKTKDKIFYFDVKNDGYTLDNHRRKIQGANDLQIVNSADFKDEQDTLSIGFNVLGLGRIKNNDYNLIGSAYRAQKKNSKYPMVKLGEICEELKNYADKDWKKYDVCTISSAKGGIIYQTKFFKNSVASENRERYKIIAPDEFGYRPPGLDIGTIGYNKFDKSIIVSPLYVVFSCDKKRVDGDYLFSVFKSKYFRDIVKPLMVGTARPQITYNKFKEIKIPLPPLTIQKKFKELEEKIEKGNEVIEKAKDDIEQKLKYIYE